MDESYRDRGWKKEPRWWLRAFNGGGGGGFRDVIFHSCRKRSNAPLPSNPCAYPSGCLPYRANVDRLLAARQPEYKRAGDIAIKIFSRVYKATGSPPPPRLALSRARVPPLFSHRPISPPKTNAPVLFALTAQSSAAPIGFRVRQDALIDVSRKHGAGRRD